MQSLASCSQPAIMSSRVKFAYRLVLATVFALGVYYLPRFWFGTLSTLELDNDDINMALRPGRQILGLRLEYGKKLNVAITRMNPHTDYEVRLSYPASVSHLFYPHSHASLLLSCTRHQSLIATCSTPRNAQSPCIRAPPTSTTQQVALAGSCSTPKNASSTVAVRGMV